MANRTTLAEARRHLSSVVATTVISAGLLLATAWQPAVAAEVDAQTAARAQRLAVSVCSSCHGPRGNSEQPKFPRLAGQSATYLAAQLRAFKAQTRGDPDAISYMWGMAGNLDETVITALAAYYAAQPAGHGAAADPTLVARGKDIFENGVAASGVPACAACHGADAHGTADFPRLAGQHSQYLLKQIRSFQNSTRDVAVMHGVAQSLQESEMQAVAAYLQTQP
jgi:cytochrome c553